MKAFETLASHTSPAGHLLTLHHRDGDYFVHLNGEELMATRSPDSERALATLACGDLGARSRVLIGGLGLGYTLRAALDVLPADAKVVVAELFACIIDWNRRFLPDLQAGALTDPRTTIRNVDVWREIERGGPWHGILLDVDNGPEAPCLEDNDRLYDRRGLAVIRKALAPGGVVAFWSAQRNERFLKTLRKSGFSARCQSVKGRGVRHQVFVATVTAGRGRS
jgi:spermidine synthase